MYAGKVRELASGKFLSMVLVVVFQLAAFAVLVLLAVVVSFCTHLCRTCPLHQSNRQLALLRFFNVRWDTHALYDTQRTKFLSLLLSCGNQDYV